MSKHNEILSRLEDEERNLQELKSPNPAEQGSLEAIRLALPVFRHLSNIDRIRDRAHELFQSTDEVDRIIAFILEVQFFESELRDIVWTVDQLSTCEAAKIRRSPMDIKNLGSLRLEQLRQMLAPFTSDVRIAQIDQASGRLNVLRRDFIHHLFDKEHSPEKMADKAREGMSLIEGTMPLIREIQDDYLKTLSWT